MKIYDRLGNELNYSSLLADIPITKDCQHVQELMKDNFVQLSWHDTEKYSLPVGAYVIPYPNEVSTVDPTDPRYPLKYRLFTKYHPDGKNETEYEYQPQFRHPIMWLSTLPFFLATGDISTWRNALKKTTWTYVGSAGGIAWKLVEVINWFAGNYQLFGDTFGDNWVALVDSDLSASASVNIDGLDLMSAAGQIANAFDCEFHFDFERKEFRLGEIRYGTEVTLKSGQNVSTADVQRPKQPFYNAFLVKGSTRNLSQPTPSGENAQVTERLGLYPGKYPDGVIYTDGASHMIPRDLFLSLGTPMQIQELIFDGIYPKLELYLYNIRERKCYLLNELKEKVPDQSDPTGYRTYSKWYCRLAYPVYNSSGEITGWEDYTLGEHSVIDGQTLGITFLPNTETGAATSMLIGQGDFDASYYFETPSKPEVDEDDINQAGFQPYAGDYRIIFKQTDNIIIPTTSNGGMYPTAYNNLAPDIRNNKATLINIVVSDTYKTIAQKDLEVAALKKIRQELLDNNNYTVSTNAVVWKSNPIDLRVGQAIVYNDGKDLTGGTSYVLDTHIIKITTQLDFPWCKDIVLGNEKTKSNASTLKEQVDSLISGNGTGLLSDAQIEELIKHFGGLYFLSKKNDDTAQGFITFVKGLQVGDRFVPGLLGEGGVFRKESDGTTYIEADKLYIRMKAYFDTVEIRRWYHSSGNRMATNAGMKCCRVEWRDSSGNVLEQTTANRASVAYFRCYFRGTDGDQKVTNDFLVGDLAYCKVTNVESSSSLYQHGFWRVVIGRNAGTGTTVEGEYYIDLSNAHDANGDPVMTNVTVSGSTYSVLSFQSGSDFPVAEDDIVQLGNINDTSRRGAIIEFVSGADAPAYQIFQDLGATLSNPYSLNNKCFVHLGYDSQYHTAKVFIGDPNETTYLKYHHVNGVPELKIKAKVEFTSPTTGTQTDLETFASAVASGMADLQSQIDGEIDTWFYEGTPTLNNAPASSWTTNTEKDRHLGDLYYDIGTGQTAGFAYRFTKDSSNVYQWQYIEDTAITEALAAAARAQDTADSKRRVFVAQPTAAQAYDVGDLWVNATYNSGGVSYNNDVLRCMTAKSAGASFSISHWMLASKYTDDTKFNNYINAILNGSGATGDSATAAAAQKAIIDAVGGATVVDGGLLLTSLIAMRKYNGSGDRTDVRNYTTYAGISGEYDSTVYGGGLAAWYGGAMIDKYNPTTQQYDVQNGAKIGFRFDGSGYVAGGAIAWDSTGLTVANISSLVASDSIKIGVGTNLSNVLTQATADLRYVTIDFFNSIFAIYRGNDRVLPNANTGNIDAIKALVGLYTDQYISAKGQNSGGGGASLNEPLASINNAGLNAPTMAGSVLVYTANGWGYSSQNNVFATNFTAAGTVTANGVSLRGYTNDHIVLAGGGAIAISSLPSGTGSVNSITIGSGGTNYTPDVDGIVTIPAYPNTSGLVNSIQFNGGNPIYPVSGVAALGGLTTSISVNGSSYSVTSSGVITLPNYPNTANFVSSVQFNGGTPISPVSGVATLGGLTTKISVNGSSYSVSSGGVITLPNYPSTSSFVSSVQFNGGTPKTPSSGVVSLGGLTTSISVNGSSYSVSSSGVITLPNYPSTSGLVSSIQFNGGNPIGPASGIVSLGGLTTKIKINGSTYNVSSSGLVDLGTFTATDNTKLPLTGGTLSGMLNCVGIIINSGSGVTGGINSATAIHCRKSSGRAFAWGAASATSEGPHYVGHNSEHVYMYADSLPLDFYTGGSCRIRIATGGGVGIGTTSFNTFKLFVSADSSATYVGGNRAWTNTSDMRKKDFIGNVDISFDRIVQTPLFYFKWKDPSMGVETQIGTSAQYWQTIAPEIIADVNGELAMQYSVASLIAAVVTARKVQTHEQRIKQLELENEALKQRIEEL